jgi:hypothetical protein
MNESHTPSLKNPLVVIFLQERGERARSWPKTGKFPIDSRIDCSVGVIPRRESGAVGWGEGKIPVEISWRKCASYIDNQPHSLS